MSHDELSSRLREVFATTLDDPEFELEPTLKMGEIDAWDSFNHINLMLGIEAEFGVEFDSDEIGNLMSVGEISEALQRRLGAVER
jgi:acyl carrier protein